MEQLSRGTLYSYSFPNGDFSIVQKCDGNLKFVKKCDGDLSIVKKSDGLLT